MSLAGEDAGSYSIEAIPKGEADRANLGRVRIKLDKGRLVPVAIRLWGRAGDATITYSLEPGDVEADRAIASSWFDGPRMVEQLKVKEGWAVGLMPAPPR